MTKNNQHKYALELTGILVSGMGMMLLIVVSAWVAAVVILASRDVSDQAIGEVPSLRQDSSAVAYLKGLELNSGRVAGVVDDASIEEASMRNDAAEWLSGVRSIQSLPVAYRDGVLDRNAQNHARFAASKCSVEQYGNWEESLNLQIDEGLTDSFTESIFRVTTKTLASELPGSAIDYSRLFTNYDALGVGVAEIPSGANCGAGFILVFHMAGIR